MITSKKKIAVFSGASAPEPYSQLGYMVGKLLGEDGYAVITGGGPGMMREVNKGAMDAGTESWGICIEHRAEEIEVEHFTYHEVYERFDERNDRLLSIADGFIVLPGGLGTVVEALQITQRKKFQEVPTNTPLLFVSDFYKNLHTVFVEMKQAGFISDDLDALYEFVSDPEVMMVALNTYFQTEALDAKVS